MLYILENWSKKISSAFHSGWSHNMYWFNYLLYSMAQKEAQRVSHLIKPVKTRTRAASMQIYMSEWWCREHKPFHQDSVKPLQHWTPPCRAARSQLLERATLSRLCGDGAPVRPRAPVGMDLRASDWIRCWGGRWRRRLERKVARTTAWWPEHEPAS
jgi:hypothetical protein